MNSINAELQIKNIKLKIQKMKNKSFVSGTEKDLNQGTLRSSGNIANSYNLNFSNSKLDFIHKIPKIKKIRNNSNTNISTINSSIMIRQDKKKKFNFDSDLENSKKVKLIGTQFQEYSKYLKGLKNSQNDENFRFCENNPNRSSPIRKNYLSSSKFNESNKNNPFNLFMSSSDKKILLTKTLKKNKDLSDDLSKLNKISQFNFIQEKPSLLKQHISDNNFKLFYEKSNSPKNNSNSFPTKTTPRFKDQIALNNYLIKHFNIGSPNVKYFNSKKRIKLISNFYERRKEKKLNLNKLSIKKSLSLSGFGNEKFNSKKDNYTSENFVRRPIKNIEIERISKTINLGRHNKMREFEMFENFVKINNKENQQNLFRDQNYKIQNFKNLEADTIKDKFAQNKNPKNVFRMRASHILSVYNDLIEDDKLNTLNMVKVPHLKNKKLKDFLQKIKKAPGEIHPKFNNVAQTNFIDNFNKYKKELDSQILDTILAQKKMPAQSYLKMKFRKSTLEKFRQYEAKLDPHVLK